MTMDWEKLFTLDVPLLEIFIRGSIIYLALLLMLRFFKRQAGELTVTDILVLMLVADASQNAMAGEYRSILDGLIIVLTIVFWNYFLDWLTLRSKVIEKFTYPPPIPLFQDKKIESANLRKQYVTEDQLMSMLREHGIDNLRDVKAVFLEVVVTSV